MQGEIQSARGQKAEALATLIEADNATEQFLVRASLARAYTAAGKIDESISTWQSFLSKPGGILNWEALVPFLEGHYELAQAYAARRRNDDAAKVLDELLKFWSGADPDLPLFQKAQRLRRSIR
jgi:tetratricopeptide (TPR) repeat protein